MKTMSEIRDEKVREYMHSYKGTASENNQDAFSGFMAGWTARNKLDNEALKLAVEALELVQDKTETDPAGEVELRARAQFVYYRVSDALAEIRKLRGEV